MVSQVKKSRAPEPVDASHIAREWASSLLCTAYPETDFNDWWDLLSIGAVLAASNPAISESIVKTMAPVKIQMRLRTMR